MVEKVENCQRQKILPDPFFPLVLASIIGPFLTIGWAFYPLSKKDIRNWSYRHIDYYRHKACKHPYVHHEKRFLEMGLPRPSPAGTFSIIVRAKNLRDG